MHTDNTVPSPLSDHPRLLILIPVYNGEQTVGRVMESVHAVMKNVPVPYQVLAVNDGSTDGTEKILRDTGAHFLSHGTNLGKGAALKTGFRYASANGFTLIATLDADGQHDPAFLPEMIRKLTAEKLDLVIGTRKKEIGKMSPARIFSNAMTSRLISLRARTRIPDSQSGYRIIRTEALSTVTLKTNRYETESELLVKAGKNRWRFGFVPVSTIYAGETSHIRHVRDTLRFIKMYFSI